MRTVLQLLTSAALVAMARVASGQGVASSQPIAVVAVVAPAPTPLTLGPAPRAASMRSGEPAASVPWQLAVSSRSHRVSATLDADMPAGTRLVLRLDGTAQELSHDRPAVLVSGRDGRRASAPLAATFAVDAKRGIGAVTATRTVTLSIVSLN